ncbi:MAG: hypothetical protein GY906_36740, partial [bacterium]|nr:hypothetical protein [bacterium]
LEAIELAMQRGVTHRVLTNSLASTNLLAAHSVYTKYRKNLLRIGFEIFEMRPDPIFAEDHIAPSIGGSVLGLHAKVAVVDRSQVLIGSYNFNKAGDLMCTENGILISSPALAETVSAMLEQIMRPENSWSVVLEGSQNPENGGSDKLRWIGVEDGHPVRLKSEPEVGFFRRLGVGFYWLFPLKSLI